jgi:hypothetical protein
MDRNRNSLLLKFLKAFIAQAAALGGGDEA